MEKEVHMTVGAQKIKTWLLRKFLCLLQTPLSSTDTLNVHLSGQPGPTSLDAFRSLHGYFLLLFCFLICDHGWVHQNATNMSHGTLKTISVKFIRAWQHSQDTPAALGITEGLLCLGLDNAVSPALLIFCGSRMRCPP